MEPSCFLHFVVDALESFQTFPHFLGLLWTRRNPPVELCLPCACRSAWGHSSPPNQLHTINSDVFGGDEDFGSVSHTLITRVLG